MTADRYVTGAAYPVSAGVAPIRAAPAGDAEQWSQALFGETFTVYDERDGFGWGQHGFDGYVGWTDMAALSAPVLPITHRVTALRTYVFSEPRIKSAPVFLLSRNALVSSEGEEGRFVKAARAGWVVKEHLAAPDVQAADPAAPCGLVAGRDPTQPRQRQRVGYGDRASGRRVRPPRGGRHRADPDRPPALSRSAQTVRWALSFSLAPLIIAAMPSQSSLDSLVMPEKLPPVA